MVSRWKCALPLYRKLTTETPLSPGAQPLANSTAGRRPSGQKKLRQYLEKEEFLCKTLPKVATEMARCVRTYNLTHVLNIVGVEPLVLYLRNDLKAARTSSENSFGSSQAAKCPPRSTSLK